MHYCPKCFNKSLRIQGKGVVHIIINGKQMDKGRFFYVMSEKKVNYLLFKEKFESFFQWYSDFKNIDPITTVHLVTKKGYCTNRCKFESNSQFSVIDILISSEEVNDLLVSLGKRYGIGINLGQLR